MVSIPNFEQLKEACGSDQLKDYFKFLFVQEECEHDGLITKIVEKCDDMRRKIVKFAELIQEGQCCSHFDVAACDGSAS